MRILFISGWFPYPPDNGARMRLFHLLRQLGRQHEIALLSFVQDKPVGQRELGVVNSFCQVLGTLPCRPFRPARLRALLRLFSPLPRAVLETYSPEMEALVRLALHQQPFDLLIASEIGPGISTSIYALKANTVPCVIEDLELSMIRNKILAEDGWAGRMRHRLTWWKQRRYASHLLRRAAGCTVASREEQALLHSIAPRFESFAVVPNGVELEAYEGDWGPPDPDTLIFPGALTYQANFDAMAFFIGSILPRIQARRPGATLRITGRTNGVPLQRLPAGDGVIFTGYLDDVRPAVARACACVVPLLTGGGTRLKILEAMALGTPVVSTGRGAEGLEVTPGQDILVADKEAEFAEAVLRLLGDETLRERLAANGRSLVREKYGWGRIGEDLDQFLQRVVQRSRQAGER